MSEKFTLVECPRDAMQGLHDFVPTDKKIEYINQLLKVGFDTLDFGSFVSPKAIPQMRDTADVYSGLDLNNMSSKLLAIVANLRGAKDACRFDHIEYLGFPFSISETFQIRNTNSNLDTALERLLKIKEVADDHDKKIVVYLSMGFGNPYGDPWNADILTSWTGRMVDLGFEILSLSDTIGIANPSSISYAFDVLISKYPEIQIGAHLHTTLQNWRDKVEAAYQNGCRRMDAAILGFGGCPMAQDALVGNMPTEQVMSFLNENNLAQQYDLEAFQKSIEMARDIFPT